MDMERNLLKRVVSINMLPLFLVLEQSWQTPGGISHQRERKQITLVNGD